MAKLPTSSKVSDLKTFLGLVNYYAKFLPDLATRLALLCKLLKQDKSWHWSNEQQTAFQDVKTLLLPPQILANFDDTKPIIIASDASPFGVGAILSQILADESEHSVAYASHSFSPTDRKYSRLDKEALAIISGIGKFHQYICGRKFTLYTDHKPLIHIFNASKSEPAISSARLQRWALTLSAYTYTVKGKSGKQQGNADALSRFPLAGVPISVPTPAETIAVSEHLSTIPLTANYKQSTIQYCLR